MFSLAFKNLFRYKKRTLVTAFAIAIGIVSYILMDALLIGVGEESNLNYISYELSAGKFYAPSYFENKDEYPVDYLISPKQRTKLESYLESKGINYAPRFLSTTELSFYEGEAEVSGSINTILVALDSQKDNRVYPIKDKIIEGTYLENNKEGILIGSALAHNIGLKLNSVVTLLLKGKEGFIETVDLPIIGIFEVDDVIVNSNQVLLDYEFLNSLLYLEDYVSEYGINLNSKNALTGANRLKKQFSTLKGASSDFGLEFYSWKEIGAEVLALLNSKTGFSKIFLFFIFLIAFIGISNTIMLCANERKNEIATLKALGYNYFYIQCLFIIEGTYIGLLGCSVGLIISVLANVPLVNKGLDFSFMLDSIDVGFRISGIMHSAWNYLSFVKAILFSAIAAAFSAYFPVRRIAKLEIATIFRSI